MVDPGNVCRIDSWVFHEFIRLGPGSGGCIPSSRVRKGTTCIVLDKMNWIVQGFYYSLAEIMLNDGRVVIIQDETMERI